jgi:hypothetical protein
MNKEYFVQIRKAYHEKRSTEFRVLSAESKEGMSTRQKRKPAIQSNRVFITIYYMMGGRGGETTD